MATPRKVAVVASGVTKWGVRREASLKDLMAEGGKACLDSNKNIKNTDVEGLVTSCVYPQRSGPQSHCSPIAAGVLGIQPKVYQHTDCQCESGTVGLRIIWSAIQAGLIDIGMALGFERILLPTHGEVFLNASLGMDHEWEQCLGITPPGMYALVARAHMEKYGTTEEQMAMVAVKNRRHSLSNIAAHFRKEITLEQAMTSRPIASPLKLFDCCVNTDGAAAMILASEERAKELTDKPIWILGFGQSLTGAGFAGLGDDVTDWQGVRLAGERAYEMAGIGPDDVDVAELHDCFSISELIEYEMLGFCPKGESGRFIEAGQADYGGKIVTQPRGGLIACGHPFGATGIAQGHEICLQLRGEAGERQVPGAKIGLTQNMASVGADSGIMIYGSEEP